MSKIKQISVWHKFRPSIICWKGKAKRSFSTFTYDQTYNEGEMFKSGFFTCLKVRNASFHLLIQWWTISFKN